MSAALNARADSSSQSGLTLQDLSLGSLASFSTPAKYRVPSTSSGTTAPSSAPLNTPSPSGTHFSRRRTDDTTTPVTKRLAFSKLGDDDEDDDRDVLDTPGNGKLEATGTPMPNRLSSKRKSGTVGAKGSSNLTLRDQEKHIDALKKENFNIKLKVHFLEERLAQLAPDQIDAALKQNINLKIEVQQRGLEMKKYKKLVLELERELERQQRARGRERELEEKLEDMERELREVRRRKGGAAPADEGLRERNAELEDRQVQLEDELDSAKGMLEENIDEIEHLQEQLERKGGVGHDSDVSGRRAKLEARIEELEAENEDLRVKLDDHVEVLTQREDEREDLLDEIQGLKLDVEDLSRRREAEVLERSDSRAQILEEREEREAIEEDLNGLRDKLAAAAIESSQKDDELEMKNREIQELVVEHERIIEVVEAEWRGEVEEARGQVEELRDAVAERDADSKELRLHISELESNTTDLHNKFETALAHLEHEAEEKDAEIESANREIEKLGQRVYELEDEVDQIRAESDRLRDDDAVERERLDALVSALKEKVAQYKAELQDMTNLYEQVSQDIHVHRARQEELARHVEDLVEEVRHERELREKTELELDSQANRHESDLRHDRRELDAKDSALQSALSDLARAQALLTQRDADLADVQAALRAVEAESRKLGENHTTDRFSLQLEVDRMRRDIDRLEEELRRARVELGARDAKTRDRDNDVDRLHTENRELTTQLAAQTQARLNVTEKLDATQNTLRTAESELASCRQRLSDVEQRLSKDQRSSLHSETQLRDQLTERNTLLLTIYSYMDRILGVDKTSKKAETKPFTNFSVFHELLMSRLKALNQISSDFERRSKEVEARYSDRLGDLRKQLDQRWKQIDKFEGSLKNLSETKQGWKRKFSAKEGELEALKSTNAELSSQLSSIRRPGQAESFEIKSLQARAANAERRLTNAQNQLLASEEKMATMNQKTTVADNKWEARRQGAKERVAELEANVKALHRQIDLANKRSQQLNDVIETNKGSSSPRS
ncbi:hypothetical protein DFH11DRAFT_1877990 [Phellopilus nigrolimitatus]|nr:hypothetical protein DFH11DRAFT_1877990 [Phellopilus nigrolimitatus]